MTTPPAGRKSRSYSSAQSKLDAARVGATEPTGGWVRRIFDPVFIALIAVSCVTAAVGIWRAASDGEGAGSLSMSLYIGGAALPTAWSVLRGIWHRDPEFNAIMAALNRTVAAPFLSIWPAIITAGITVSLPATTRAIEAASRDDGWHYYFPKENSTPLAMALVMGGLLCLIVAILVGLALSIVVVLPGMAFFNPKVAVEGNMLDSSEEAMPANTLAMRFMAVLLVLIFAIPTLIVFGKREARADTIPEAFQNSLKFFSDTSSYGGDLAWALGIALIPLGVFALIMVKVKQKPDHAMRDAYGVNALGDRGKGH